MSLSEKRAKLIIERWAAELEHKDRTLSAVSGNFDEVFYELWKASVDFETVHEMLPDIVKHHLPNNFIASNTYKARKHQLNQSFTEFMNDWKKLLKDKALQSFYSYFSVEGEDEFKEEEKKYGNMSAQEYRRQRKYAESFPELDWRKLKAQMDEAMKNIENDLDIDVEVEGGQDGKVK